MAVRLARQVCEATRYQRGELVDAFAAALAETAKYEYAQAMARKAVELLSISGKVKQAQEAKKRLALYEARQPFRTSAGKSEGEGHGPA